MTKTDDLSNLTAELKDLKRRIRELETGSPLQASSVTQGRVRFIGGLLRIDSGGRVEIVGTLQIDGTTKVTGTFRVDGPWTLAGDGTISGDVTGTGRLTWNGPWNLNGAGQIAGNVTQTGNTNQKGTVTVNGGGKIVVQGGGGDVVLDSSYADPRILLGAGNISAGAASFTFAVGSQAVYFFENTIRIPAMATKPASSVPGGFVGAVHADAAGKFWRLV